MANNIYDIQSWAASTKYYVDDIIVYNNFYYYCRTEHTSSSNFTNDYNSNLWKGKLTYQGKTRPYFEWKTSYNYNVDVKPNVKKIQFGDSYIQDVSDGINNILLPLNLSFEERNLKETAAILHFLTVRNGTERFYFIAPAPHNITKNYVCQQWSHKQNFYENYSISCLFEERVI